MNIKLLETALNWDKEHTPEISKTIEKMGFVVLSMRVIRRNKNSNILRFEYLLLDNGVIIIKVLKRKYVVTWKTEE